ncbi:hypothetical protein IC620_03585 [Hazenella sp. IB182357]|uniref:Uncharacterized protein n=1 Tax=Polycladospora coralii TaxID=2771432 RepID=A0A926N7H7_9BACL|nr:hypothetical protein [Polycladospora coralii]MBD1371436.1 hypothetical protein [Polycladospora coralii]MBS7530404.1 hypothetical protein [Polycladospora coralii]
MNYVKPEVVMNQELSINEAIEWAIVAIVAIVAVGGVAAYCISKGGSFEGGFDWDDQSMLLGCGFGS